MKTKEFFGKFCSLYLWGNLLAMVLVVVGLCVGVKYGLAAYTHHGEGIMVPRLVNMSCSNARLLIDEQGLELVVTDSGYNKRLPADCILTQSPEAGMKVKAGHIIYVSVNAKSSPTLPIPDVVDNSSFREAEAKLRALGFKLLPPKRILGERDWVYGILCHGRRVATGDRISIDSPLTLLVGNGQYGADEDIDYMEPDPAFLDTEEESDIDDFEEVEEPVEEVENVEEIDNSKPDGM